MLNLEMMEDWSYFDLAVVLVVPFGFAVVAFQTFWPSITAWSWATLIGLVLHMEMN